MANHDDDLATHQQTWNNFVRLMIFGVIGGVLVLAWMATFLTP
ncbi:MAG: aa3-type cytochrome c oxidase subunit IV [Alphaproteobacteria bacterium]|nr:aa3-type cytochrome c oxidase subunit IV [Alphaproteobacteria bacterium]